MISFDNFIKLIRLYIPTDFSFYCYDCGDCCRHESGYIFLLDAEIKKIAGYFNLSKKEFLNNFTIKLAEEVYSLKEKENLDCVFWDKGNRNNKGGCSIYKIRPLQCRNFPFWLTTFSSKENFDYTAKRCPGIMSKEGRIYKNFEVYKLVYDDLKKRFLHYNEFLSDEVKSILLE